MFREMRRKDREIPLEESKEILKIGIDGVLGTISEHGYPYTVPVNYAYVNNKIYFHSATTGEKLDNIKRNPKVSFTVITRNDILEEEFSTDFESVIVFGKAKLINPSKEVLMELIKKYSNTFLKAGKAYVDKSYKGTQLVEITIDHMTGKKRK